MVEFVASKEGSVVVTVADLICLKSDGGTEEDTSLFIKDGMLSIARGTCDKIAITLGLVRLAGAFLVEITENLVEYPDKPLILYRLEKTEESVDRIPILRVDSVDLDAQTATITPHEALEASVL